MTELTQPIQRERAPRAGGPGGLFDNPHEPAGLVTVAVGPYVERLPLGNNTVAQIRARFGTRFDIDPRTQAVLDGREVGDDTVVRTGQVLMFVHKSGEKGAGHFTLAPALSPGERENDGPVSERTDHAYRPNGSEKLRSGANELPLPWGGGRGENSPKDSRLEPLNQVAPLLSSLSPAPSGGEGEVHGELRPPTLDAHRGHEPRSERRAPARREPAVRERAAQERGAPVHGEGEGRKQIRPTFKNGFAPAGIVEFARGFVAGAFRKRWLHG